jgi:hypothetical protein
MAAQIHVGGGCYEAAKRACIFYPVMTTHGRRRRTTKVMARACHEAVVKIYSGATPFEQRRPRRARAQRRRHGSFLHGSDFSQSAAVTPALRTVIDLWWRALRGPSCRAYSYKVEVAAPHQSLFTGAGSRSMAAMSLPS